MFKDRVPIDKMALSCDVVKQINANIARNIHSEDGILEARVIAHTALCDSCRDHFNDEVKKVREEKSKSANTPNG